MTFDIAAKLFPAIVAGTFAGGSLLLWFSWGVWRLHKRGPAAPLGKDGWLALSLPLFFVLICALSVTAE